MRFALRLHPTLLLSLITLLQAPAVHAGGDAVDDFVVIVNVANRTPHMGKASISEVFKTRHRAWANQEPIVLVLQERDAALHEAFCRTVLGSSPEEFARRLLTAEGQGTTRVKVVHASSDLLARAHVAGNPGAIAYLRAGPVDESARVVFSPAAPRDATAALGVTR